MLSRNGIQVSSLNSVSLISNVYPYMDIWIYPQPILLFLSLPKNRVVYSYSSCYIILYDIDYFFEKIIEEGVKYC